jgi:hypothetical protein
MSPGAVADAGFQVPDTVGHVGRRDKDVQRSSLEERFASRAFADTLRGQLGFAEDEIEAAVDVLLEVAPLLVNKQVVAMDDAAVRPPRVPRAFFGNGAKTRRDPRPARLPATRA